MLRAWYGVDLAKVPDTYIEPFVAYRAWNPKYFVVPANMVPFDAMIHALAAGRQPMPFVIILLVLAYILGYRAGRRSVLR
jgi:hypothetical protein